MYDDDDDEADDGDDYYYHFRFSYVTLPMKTLVSPFDFSRIFFLVSFKYSCWSYVGKQGGRQEVSLGNGCEYKGVAIHEIGRFRGRM